MKNGLTKNDSVAIKGIAILFMLFHHLFLSTERFEGYVIDFSPFTQDTVVEVALLLKICVSMFAFITGYGLLKSISKVRLNKKDVAKWNISRLIKTMSGFWFIYILSFIVTFIIDRLPIETYFKGSRANGLVYMLIDFLGLANFFGTPSINSTWWYMSAAIVFILIIPFVYVISKKIGYLPVIAVLCALPRLLDVGYPGGINIYTFILPVILGMMCADYNIFEKISEKSPKNKIASYIVHFILFGGIIVCLMYPSHLRNRNESWEFIYGISPAFVIIFARYCIVRIPVIKNVLEFLGKHSMAIFLSHTFIRYNYMNEFIYSLKSFMLIYLVLLVLSVALAFVLDTLKKLCRYDKLIEKLNKKITDSI